MLDRKTYAVLQQVRFEQVVTKIPESMMVFHNICYVKSIAVFLLFMPNFTLSRHIPAVKFDATNALQNDLPKEKRTSSSSKVL